MDKESLGHEYMLLFMAAALLLFIGNGQLLVTDSVECNYALTAKEMVRSGDWLSPQIFGRYWFDKPIFFYWLTALSFKLFGFTEFAARFFPAAFGLAAIGLVAWGGNKLFSARAGFYSALVLVSFVEFFLISKSIITDSVLFFFFSGTLLYFYLAYRDNKPVYWYLMYGCAGLAVLTKGPIGCLLPGLIIVSFLLWEKQGHVIVRARVFSGILLFLVIVLPWYGYMYYVHGSEFLDSFLGTHNYLRAVVSEHPKDNVFYYYAIINFVACLPWSWMLPGIICTCWKQEGKLADCKKFLLCWLGIVFLFFQLMATKYLTYTYPLLFPTALLIGQQLAEREEQGHKLNLVPFGMAIGAIGLYLCLILTVAIPFSQQRSAKDLAQALSLEKQETNMAVYGSYPTSAVFYDSPQLTYLVREKEAEDFKPEAYSWSLKHMMPYSIAEESKHNLVIVDQRELGNFLHISPKKWHIIARTRKYLVLKAR